MQLEQNQQDDFMDIVGDIKTMKKYLKNDVVNADIKRSSEVFKLDLLRKKF